MSISTVVRKKIALLLGELQSMEVSFNRYKGEIISWPVLQILEVFSFSTEVLEERHIYLNAR